MWVIRNIIGSYMQPPMLSERKGSGNNLERFGSTYSMRARVHLNIRLDYDTDTYP